MGILHCESVDKNVHGRAVFLSQDFFSIAQHPVALQGGKHLAMAFRDREYSLARVRVQQSVAAVVAEHADQRVVDLNEAAVRAAEEEPFLNVVEQLAIAALGFAAVGDVLEYMDGLEAFAAGGMHF